MLAPEGRLWRCNTVFLVCVDSGAPKYWNSFAFGDTRKQLEDDIKELEAVQKSEPTEANIHRARELESRVAALLRREEIYWYQRSMVGWMKDGDKNTRYFHNIANGRKKRNHIA
ncbi:hypothetical protein ACS0TY_028038 [Phlomoides rotata]